MKTFFTLLLILIFNRSFYSQTLIHPDIPSDFITDLHYLNDLEIIFINAGGCIYKSYDGGINWQLKKFYQNSSLSEIEFIDNNLGFIRPENYSSGIYDLIYTNDGGETWNEHPLSITPVNSFLPINETIMLKATVEGKIQRLDNFFDLWETTFQVQTYIDSGYDYIEIVPFGSIKKLSKMNNGMLTALGTNENAYYHQIMDDSLSYILNSEDYGLSWDTLWIGLDQLIKDIVFVNDSTGWMISDTSLFKSSDGGKTWNLQNIPYNGAYYKSLFAGGNNIYLLDYYNEFIKSTDSGTTWSFNSLGLYNDFISIIFNDQNGFIFGEGLLKTTDSGQNWENLNQYVRNNIYDVDFISAMEGIALGSDGVYKTYDGGFSWIPKFNPEGFPYDNPGTLEMINDSVGFLISRYKNSYKKTADGGENWENIAFYEENQHYDNIEFYDENLGILTAWEESVPGSQIYDKSNAFISTNGGEIWAKKPLDSLYFDKLQFTNPSHLWGINRYGLWISNNLADTWQRVLDERYVFFHNSFDFYDSLYGVVTCSHGEAYLTTDGGSSWKSFEKPVRDDPNDCKIIGPYIDGSQRILETGHFGKLMITYIYPDGEIDFAYQMPSYTKKTLNKIEVLVEDDFPNVWIAGDGFTILFNQFEKFPLDIKEENNQLQVFSLFQNYPNPFNPSTTIRYQIPQRGFVSLEIYNLLGEEIKTLVNEEQSAGTYNIDFNGETLSSGIYFYTLKSGNFIETKKFILLK